MKSLIAATLLSASVAAGAFEIKEEYITDVDYDQINLELAATLLKTGDEEKNMLRLQDIYNQAAAMGGFESITQAIAQWSVEDLMQFARLERIAHRQARGNARVGCKHCVYDTIEARDAGRAAKVAATTTAAAEINAKYSNNQQQFSEKTRKEYRARIAEINAGQQ